MGQSEGPAPTLGLSTPYDPLPEASSARDTHMMSVTFLPVTQSGQQQMTKSALCLSLWPRHARRDLWACSSVCSALPTSSAPPHGPQASPASGGYSSWHRAGVTLGADLPSCRPPPRPSTLADLWCPWVICGLWVTAVSCFHGVCAPHGPGRAAQAA